MTAKNRFQIWNLHRKIRQLKEKKKILKNTRDYRNFTEKTTPFFKAYKFKKSVRLLRTCILFLCFDSLYQRTFLC